MLSWRLAGVEAHPIVYFLVICIWDAQVCIKHLAILKFERPSFSRQIQTEVNSSGYSYERLNATLPVAGLVATEPIPNSLQRQAGEAGVAVLQVSLSATVPCTARLCYTFRATNAKHPGPDPKDHSK